MDNEMFKTHSVYFRNALGKANRADYPVRVVETDVYLIGLYTNLLMEKVELRAEDIGWESAPIKGKGTLINGRNKGCFKDSLKRKLLLILEKESKVIAVG